MLDQSGLITILLIKVISSPFPFLRLSLPCIFMAGINSNQVQLSINSLLKMYGAPIIFQASALAIGDGMSSKIDRTHLLKPLQPSALTH